MAKTYKIKVQPKGGHHYLWSAAAMVASIEANSLSVDVTKHARFMAYTYRCSLQCQRDSPGRQRLEQSRAIPL